MPQTKYGLLDLPYDVRYLIYEHLFPPLRQIYILASHDSLHLMNNDHSVPVSILRVNRQLHRETAEFLYNNYLYNIIGLKQNCVKLYKPFLETLSKHARHTVRLDGFSNGDHSATSCLSIQSGNSQLKTLQNRRRGKPRTVQQLQREVEGLPPWSMISLGAFMSIISTRRHMVMISATFVAFLAIVLGVLPLFHDIVLLDAQPIVRTSS